MNFAGWTFVLFFLPAAVLGFHLIRGPRAGPARAVLLVTASLAFYAWSGLHNAVVLACSIAVNYGAGKLLTEGASSRGRRKAVMWAAVLLNLLLLTAFKIEALNTSSSDGFRAAETILIPLALSYVTFQQIGFVVACYRGQVERFAFGEYLFFVAFFPQLVLGPIVRFQDMAGQLREGRLLRAGASDVAVGLSIFIFGLAQKVLLADQIAPAVDQVFAAAQAGPVSPAESWFAVVAFQLQLYFDFAGYADMAIGLGRMFGVRLPINFDRPLFAVDRFDLWRRWHVTFAIFMRTHVFFPLVRHWKIPVAGALAITGILSGLWHGLGWTFVIWGLIQTAILLVVHERKKRDRSGPPRPGLGRVQAVAFTFLFSALIGGLFRAPTLESAGHIYGALAGVGGLADGASLIGARALVMLPLCALAVWALPNSAQFFRRHWDALDLRPDAPATPPHPLRGVFEFSLTRRWALAMGATLLVCLALLDEARRFVYVQF